MLIEGLVFFKVHKTLLEFHRKTVKHQNLPNNLSELWPVFKQILHTAHLVLSKCPKALTWETERLGSNQMSSMEAFCVFWLVTIPLKCECDSEMLLQCNSSSVLWTKKTTPDLQSEIPVWMNLIKPLDSTNPTMQLDRIFQLLSLPQTPCLRFLTQAFYERFPGILWQKLNIMLIGVFWLVYNYQNIRNVVFLSRPSCFYTSPEQTNQTLASSVTFCVLHKFPSQRSFFYTLASSPLTSINSNTLVLQKERSKPLQAEILYGRHKTCAKRNRLYLELGFCKNIVAQDSKLHERDLSPL